MSTPGKEEKNIGMISPCAMTKHPYYGTSSIAVAKKKYDNCCVKKITALI